MINLGQRVVRGWCGTSRALSRKSRSVEPVNVPEPAQEHR